MSALIGTVIVLAITIAGIATALFMGAPIVVRMQERAALENVIGQFEEVRSAGNDMFVPDEARYPTLSLPSGRMSLEPGTHVMVTIDLDDTDPVPFNSCDFRVTDWTDWDDLVTVSQAGCRSAAPEASCEGIGPSGSNSCFEAYRVIGSLGNPVSLPSCTATPTTSCRLSWDQAGSTYDLAFALEADADYLFRLTGTAGSGVYAEAWLLHMDRLFWTSGSVHAAYEGGAVIAQEGDGFFLSAAPAVNEDPGGAPSYDGEPYFLRFTTMQGSEQGAVSGASSHSLEMVLDGGHVRVDYAVARMLRLDFEGRFAEAWCNAFLLRDVFASLDGDYYREDATDPGHLCSPTNPDPDGVRSVRYAEYEGGSVAQAFTFSLSQSVIHAAILL